MGLMAWLLSLLTGCPQSALPSQPVHGHILMFPVTCDYEMFALVGWSWR